MNRISIAARREKRAILVVSFGTSHPDTMEKNIAAIERSAAEAFPFCGVFRAFTSRFLVDKLRRLGRPVSDVAQALEQLYADGFTHVVCQPTHIIHGKEYDDLCRDAAPYQNRFTRLIISAPLLSGAEDYQAVVSALAGSLLPLPHGHALVLMGHGTAHFANAAYPALDYAFKARGFANVFVGTVEGFPDISIVTSQLRAYAPRHVVLTPFMVVAGDHARNDMASDEPDSWKTQIQNAGFPVSCIIKGLGEYPGIRGIYLSHLSDAIRTSNAF